MIYPYKIKAENLNQLYNLYPNAQIKETTGIFNMLFLKDNQTSATCKDGKYYIITHL